MNVNAEVLIRGPCDAALGTLPFQARWQNVKSMGPFLGPNDNTAAHIEWTQEKVIILTSYSVIIYVSELCVCLGFCRRI